MFANFSNTSQGLIKTDSRPRSDASKISCLPCRFYRPGSNRSYTHLLQGRRKKKKCDFIQPSCSRCRNSYGQDTCVWSTSRRKQRSRSRDIQSIERDVQSRPSSSSSTSSRASTTLVRKPSASTRSNSPIDLGFENFCPWSMPDVVSSISPDLSPQIFLRISTAFQNRVLCLDSDFKDSLVAQSLPLALEHPALLHAWVACSVIALSQSMPYWHEKAIRHYDSAVSGLSQALQINPHTSDKWKRETVILLHLFEGFSSKSEESALGKAHLSGAHMLFNPTVKEKSPMSYHDVLVLEAYIMHTTNNYLFQPDSQLPITHMEEAMETFKSAMGQLDMDCNWRNSPWIGFGGLDLVDMIYRTSWLTHKTYLDTADRRELQDIVARLSSWTAPACREESTSTHLDLPPKRLVILARAYWCACSYLATNLMLQEEIEDLPLDNNAFMIQTLELLDQLIEFECTINNYLWPLVVVGTAASDQVTQDHLRSLLPQFNQALGKESAKRAERFLATAWKRDLSGEMYGMRIFRDKEALHHMFF
ncbi:hypothetical protein E4T38_04140 [Aureobasidium subglaciale]|nr:hypothetical protein E4T38_04140 [Aureobasidium subglaciale]KAI5224620.1 hypothetical protein E4T40_04049 [Aureobasidium subglaciale]KAI5227705.1 hypothetical protein E4T41_04269 [Aureobasidium subglaciale]KAI5263211.1 hypothetical protein E4T46_03890 [Aureobasidium subglaciale]